MCARCPASLGLNMYWKEACDGTGDQIRINAQLIDATTGGHEWAERFDGTMADVFSLQDEVNRQDCHGTCS